MKKAVLFWLLLLLLALPALCARNGAAAPAHAELTEEGPGRFSCSFDGVRHSFLLVLPEKAEGAPLVVMLPGYGNTAEAFRLQTRFDEDAAARGYAVVYVTGAPDPKVPTSAVGWNGEADPAGNRDVEFLLALARYLQDACRLDRTRLFAVGFSNGAFMAQRLAVEASGRFTAVVSVAGMMQPRVWDERRESSSVGLFQITGEKDPVVPKNSDGSAGFSPAPAIEDVVAYWADSGGLTQAESIPLGNGSVLTKYTGPDRPRQVWHLLVSDGRHSWPSERVNGIDANALILDFLDSQND